MTNYHKLINGLLSITVAKDLMVGNRRSSYYLCRLPIKLLGRGVLIYRWKILIEHLYIN